MICTRCRVDGNKAYGRFWSRCSPSQRLLTIKRALNARHGNQQSDRVRSATIFGRWKLESKSG